jgi:hypothetical protein
MCDGLPARRALTDGLEAVRTASSCPFQRIGCRRRGFLSLRDPARVGPGHPHPTSYEEISFNPAAIRSVDWAFWRSVSGWRRSRSHRSMSERPPKTSFSAGGSKTSLELHRPQQRTQRTQAIAVYGFAKCEGYAYVDMSRRVGRSLYFHTHFISPSFNRLFFPSSRVGFHATNDSLTGRAAWSGPTMSPARSGTVKHGAGSKGGDDFGCDPLVRW